MTKQQEQMVERIREYVTKHDIYDNDPEYEIKRFDVSELEGTELIQVISVTGRKKDEGTMGELYCRTRRQIFIGTKGGLRAYQNIKNGKMKKLQGWSKVMIFGYSS